MSKTASSTPPEPPRRKRGGQPGNRNARKHGLYAAGSPHNLPGILAQARRIQHDMLTGAPSSQIETRLKRLRLSLHNTLDDSSDFNILIPLIQIDRRLANLALHVWMPDIHLAMQRCLLERLASDPMDDIRCGFFRKGIRRDADSFSFVSKKTAQNSQIPLDHPDLPSNLTGPQWEVLEPLLPPDPRLDWLLGQPPLPVAANRWGLLHLPPGESLDPARILPEHNRILQRFPGLLGPPPEPPPASRPGRPRTSPRVLLDAIFWKLAADHPWDELPPFFPPVRVCQRYYRRLFRSGRLYTLLLALHQHLTLTSGVDLPLLVRQGLFTLAPGTKVALAPGAPFTWQNHTALLFLQLARKMALAKTFE